MSNNEQLKWKSVLRVKIYVIDRYVFEQYKNFQLLTWSIV